MPVVPEVPYLAFTGNGSATAFDHVPDFTLSDPTHLHVYVDGVEIPTSDYTVNATGIVFDTAPAVATEIVLRRITPVEQPFTTPGLRIFSLARITEALDRIVRTLQEAFHGGAGSIAGAPANKRLRATGTLTPDPANADDGYLDLATEDYNGRPAFGTLGVLLPPEYPWVTVLWNGSSEWLFTYFVSNSSLEQWRSLDDVASPELCTTWEEYGGVGALSLDLVSEATPGRPGEQRHTADKLYVNTGTAELPVWKSLTLTLP